MDFTAAEHQQKDNLCGPFHAARMLRDAGIAEHGGETLDQDLVAVHAGTALPDPPLGPQVPPGARSLRDYRYPLAPAEPARSGTSANRLAQAIEELSGRRLGCVPLRGQWSAETVARLVGDVRDAGGRLIANLRTGLLWGSHPPLELLLAVLAGEEVEDPPPADWDVGHFVEFLELLQGRRGALVLVRDSYPTLGWDGHHLQPSSAVAAALMRGDGRSGGVLAVGRGDEPARVRELAAASGLSTDFWDNGTTQEVSSG